MGVSKTSGILEAYVDSVREKYCDEASLRGVVLSYCLRVAQGIRLELLTRGEVPLVVNKDSPAAKELKIALEVSRIAGLSCDGQERKLTEVLGQIIAKKHGKEAEGSRDLSFLVGLDGGSNQ
jgi:hypothetical protein